MAESTRPKRVVIVDADNPFQEIHGEFFWRQDHERALAIERKHAFREGYERGLLDSAKSAPTVVVRRRRMRLNRLVWRMFALAVALSFLVTLIRSMTR
jgi:hypothetical protein